MWNTIRRLIFNIVFWTIAFTLVFAVRYSTGDEFGFQKLAETIELSRIFGNGFFMGFFVGVAYTIMESYLKYQGVFKHSLLRVIVNRGIRQFIIASAVIFVLAWINYNKDIEIGLLNPEEVGLFDYMRGTTLVFLYLTAFFGNIILSVFRALQMKIGEDTFFDLLRGKYMKPQEADRAFLFMDLTSSTSIAERMGHVKYSALLQDCFRDLDFALENSRASVYQYVGDEVVLTWETSVAIENANCLRVFYDYLDQLDSRRSYYESTYGLVPAFKAGLNLGKVMIAEVGVVQREIAYHSDVLNTASRIMGMCNELNVHLLATNYVTDLLQDHPEFEFIDRGIVPVRGKTDHVDIYEVKKISVPEN